MVQTFVIADTHFGDEAIIRYENRPFEFVREMNQAMVEKWNQIVREEDKVFLLGDFATNLTEEEESSLLSSLNGEKILIMGNHDMHHTPARWRELGFAEAIMYPILYQEFFILSHEPLYMNRNMPYANIYGHVHANDAYKDYSCQSACVSVERIGYAPVNIEEVIKQMKESEKR